MAKSKAHLDEHVSFPISELLKKLGFNWECDHYYRYDRTSIQTVPPSENWNQDDYLCSAPTLASAQKWLREEYGIHADAVPTSNRYWRWKARITLLSYIEGKQSPKIVDVFTTYEVVLEAAINEAAQYIETKKQIKQ